MLRRLTGVGRALVVPRGVGSMGIGVERRWLGGKDVEEKDERLREQFEALPDLDPDARDAVRRKRILYRAKQRGWLEVDLVMGTWAAENVPLLDEKGLDEVEALLQCETIDIFHYVSGMKQAPPEVESDTLEQIREYVKSKPIGTADPEAYAKVKDVMSN